MKLSIFLLASLSYTFAAHAAELGKPMTAAQVSQALKSGQEIKIAFASRNSNGKDVVGCIGVNNASTKRFAPLMWFRCDLPTSNNPNNQYWIIHPTTAEHGERGYVTIKNWKSQLCMGVSGGDPRPGVDIKQFKCDNRPNQKWKLTTVTRGGHTALSIQNFDRLCIGVDGKVREGAQIQQEPCNAQADQDWKIIPFRVN